MKKIIIILCTSTLSFSAISQHITGNWEGSMDANGTIIPLVIHISKDSSGNYLSSFDSPLQKAFGLPGSGVIIKGDSVILLLKMLNGKYAGRLSSDEKTMQGKWYQGGGELPLNLVKTSDVATGKEMKRPQTPKPPFPYASEDVQYDNADGSIHFGASFTYPSSKAGEHSKQYPVVLLITGSGPQDRDETLMGHKPFAVIADYLTKRGIAVLRVDDRGMGTTTGDFRKSTTADFARDAEAGINYLKTRKEVNIKKIGLLGHSEGALIAPIVASGNKDVAFIVLLAGPGIKITRLMEQQSIDVAAAAGISQSDLAPYRLLYRDMMNTIIHEKDTTIAMKKAKAVFKEWQKGKSKSLVSNTTGVTDEASLNEFVRVFVLELSGTWFSYFINLDPSIYLEKVKCPVLALNGEKDVQVSPTANLKGIRDGLTKAGNRHFETKELAGLNHLFQHCTKCSVDEYSELEETIAPEALQMIGDWIINITH